MAKKINTKAVNQKALKSKALKAHDAGKGIRVRSGNKNLLVVGNTEAVNAVKAADKATTISSARGAKIAAAKAAGAKKKK